LCPFPAAAVSLSIGGGGEEAERPLFYLLFFFFFREAISSVMNGKICPHCDMKSGTGGKIISGV